MASLHYQRLLCAALVILLLSVVSHAQDTKGKNSWPRWRGPLHDGSLAGEELIEQFPADGPPILWIRELGQGYSGLAVVDGRIHTMTQTLYEQQLICLDAATGDTLW